METLVGKLNRMATCFGIDIYMHSHCKGKQDIYTSCKDLSWPPGVKDMVVSLQLPSLFLHLANPAKSMYYPPPVIKMPASFEADKVKSKGRARYAEDKLSKA
jgi:hypothetical protein